MSWGAAVKGAVLTLVVLGGCSSEDPPASLPSAPPSATTEPPVTTGSAPTTSAAPTGAPTVPAAAQQQTPDGAAAFVQHWFEVLGYSEGVMVSTPLRALDDGSCLSCDNFSRTIDEVAADGNRLDGGGITVDNIQANAILGDGSTTVTTLISFTEQHIIGSDGSVEVLGPAEEDVQFLFELVWVGSGWRAGGIQVIT